MTHVSFLMAASESGSSGGGLTNLVASLSSWVNMIFITLLFVGAILFAILYYFIKVRKVTSKVEKVNYSSFVRTDAKEYVKFKDIVSDNGNRLGGGGMIDLGNGVFVAGISVVGYNISSADASEQQRTMINAITFFNVVEQDIQMRQTVKAIDLTHNIEKHQEMLEQLNLDLMSLSEEYNDTVMYAEDNVDNTEVFQSYCNRLDDLKRAIYTKKHSYDECKSLLEYMGEMTKGKNRDSQKINQIMFSYTFNPNDYTEELSENEIYLKAMMELNSKANSYIEGLANCGCTCKRLTAEDLIGLMRKHMAPLSADDVTLDDLLNSSYNSLFITSDSLMELEKDRRSEELFLKQMREYEHREEQRKKIQRLESKRLEKMERSRVKKAIDRSEGRREVG